LISRDPKRRLLRNPVVLLLTLLQFCSERATTSPPETAPATAAAEN